MQLSAKEIQDINEGTVSEKLLDRTIVYLVDSNIMPYKIVRDRNQNPYEFARDWLESKFCVM